MMAHTIKNLVKFLLILFLFTLHAAFHTGLQAQKIKKREGFWMRGLAGIGGSNTKISGYPKIVDSINAQYSSVDVFGDFQAGYFLSKGIFVLHGGGGFLSAIDNTEELASSNSLSADQRIIVYFYPYFSLGATFYLGKGTFSEKGSSFLKNIYISPQIRFVPNGILSVYFPDAVSSDGTTGSDPLEFGSIGYGLVIGFASYQRSPWGFGAAFIYSRDNIKINSGTAGITGSSPEFKNDFYGFAVSVHFD